MTNDHRNCAHHRTCGSASGGSVESWRYQTAWRWENSSSKTKRDSVPAAAPDNARLMTLLTPDERDAVRQRLEDSLAAPGKLSLADLLVDQQQGAHDREWQA